MCVCICVYEREGEKERVARTVWLSPAFGENGLEVAIGYFWSTSLWMYSVRTFLTGQWFPTFTWFGLMLCRSSVWIEQALYIFLSSFWICCRPTWLPNPITMNQKHKLRDTQRGSLGLTPQIWQRCHFCANDLPLGFPCGTDCDGRWWGRWWLYGGQPVSAVREFQYFHRTD